MTVYESDIMGILNPPVTASQAGVQLVSKGEAVLDGSQSSSDLVKLCKLPAFHEPHDFILETEAIETGSGVTASVGVLNSDETDLVKNASSAMVTNFISDTSVVQGGGVKRADNLDGLGLTPANYDRVIAAKFTSAVASSANSSAAMRGKLTYYQNP